jgi:alkyl sulfatase BDS1-like metallo-beta-lactamase superfamily hydrolase
MRIEDLFDLMAVRLNGIKAEEKKIVLNFSFTDAEKHYAVIIENSVLHYDVNKQAGNADLTLHLKKRDLAALSAGETKLKDEVSNGKISAAGDINIFDELLNLLDDFEPNFSIVTP